MYYQWAPYVPVAERRRQAAAEMAKLAKKGHSAAPVVIDGRTIASTAWGKAWCENMERYSDYSNRLPRGRTYVRNGSVVDLQITAGKVEARVSGSSLYRTSITVKPVASGHWKRLCADTAGGIDSLVELLKGRFSTGVMSRLCRQGDGLFPVPKDIAFDCSCPDGAYMCKHVAAVLYGVGARFDEQPDLLFTLRQVDPQELLSKAGSGLSAAPTGAGRSLDTDDVAGLFGLEMDGEQPERTAQPVSAGAKKARTTAVKDARTSTRVGSPTAESGKRARDPFARLCAALRLSGSLDNTAARAATGLDAEGARALLRRLVADGFARVEGQKRGTRYLQARGA